MHLSQSFWLFVAFGTPLLAEEDVNYLRDIKPLLAEKCAACHGALKQEAGLRLDSGVLIRKGSENGKIVVPGKSAQSLLIERISSKDPAERMPPEGEGSALSDDQIQRLSRWINSGASSPDDEAIPAGPKDHWAYQVPKRLALPQVKDAKWSHPIDAFIASGHQEAGLEAVEKADRYTLLRRVYMDLIGLPPTRKQIAEFQNDTSPDAWQRVVDSLLESPHYGERWGRHWMDVWRYSDWDGYMQQLRGSQRHIWRWRDWIIKSLNADKGYDRMIVEMLAGDEVAPADPKILPATGFLARNFHTSNRDIWLDATVEHTAKAFLGMTINCARCHDHKYDPIPQQAYYKFRAIFEPHKVRTDRVPGQPDLMKDGVPRAYDADLEVNTFLYLAGNEKQPDKDHPLSPGVPKFLGSPFEVKPVSLPVEGYQPDMRAFVEEEQISKARNAFTAAEKALADSQAGLSKEDHTKQDDLKKNLEIAELKWKSLAARYAADRSKVAPAETPEHQQYEILAKEAARLERQLKLAEAESTQTLKRRALKKAESSPEKDVKKKQAGIAAAKKELTAAEKTLAAAKEEFKKTDAKYTPIGTEFPRTSSGRRLALAGWITDRKNPLAARVAVNHIWMRHFGEPLVQNVFDFGLRTEKPRYADLLDWLAVEFVENDWSMKHLHRLIVTSRTWQLASTANPRLAEKNSRIDSDNHLLWRANVRRLDAELVRDNVLAVSGSLDHTLGGADIDFHQGEESKRRSVYLRHAYEKQMKMLVIFDAASPNECYRRSESIIPQQALALANSSLALGQSRLLASSLWKEASDNEPDDSSAEFVRMAYLQILSRPPAEKELTLCLNFLDEQAKLLGDSSKLKTFIGGEKPKIQPAGDPAQRARENLVQVLLNHNDFVTIR